MPPMILLKVSVFTVDLFRDRLDFIMYTAHFQGSLPPIPEFDLTDGIDLAFFDEIDLPELPTPFTNDDASMDLAMSESGDTGVRPPQKKNLKKRKVPADSTVLNPKDSGRRVRSKPRGV